MSGLNTWLREHAPPAYRAVHPRRGRSFEHVYIDVNAMVYSAFRTCDKRGTPQHVAERLFAELDAALRFAKPTKTLTLAADGMGARDSVRAEGGSGRGGGGGGGGGGGACAGRTRRVAVADENGLL